jgi:hypothetical protein
MRRRLLVGHLLPLYNSTLSLVPSFANFRSSFVCELSFFLRLRTFVLPSFANFRSSLVVARVRDLLLSFLRATHGWGWLPSRNVPTKSFETVMHGLGTFFFFTINPNPNDFH